jgi:phospholipase D1/2
MFFREGHNCWQVAKADRVAFLVDGEDYFRAVANACEAARKVIYIIGWDIDSRIRLRRDKHHRQETLGHFVDRLARENPDLRIYLLEWDFAMLYSMERETWPLLSFGWQTHKRVYFELDDDHPVGASHHQKIIVVDGLVAFVGGFDLASCRWDTPEHAPVHPERSDNGEAYGPFHDVQMLVDGEAAGALASLARNRWAQVTGDDLAVIQTLEHDPWPEEVRPDIEMVEIAILRTSPEYEDNAEVREIETFYIEAIEQAESSIYIENQYLTSHIISAALERSLRKPNGPEILIVLPRKCSGWLEEETMGALRQRLIERLFRADEHRRLKICYPDLEDLDNAIINVHSKVLIIDEELLTIGSANLSNRSMGFDTECNLALSAEGQKRVQQAIAGFRNRLLAEHQGTTAAKVAAGLEKTGMLLATVESLNNGKRSLRDIQRTADETLIEALSANEIVDPERPVGMDRLLDYLGIGPWRENGDTDIKLKAWRFVIVVVCAGLLAILWRWSPLRESLALDNLLAFAAYLRESPMTTPLVLAIYLLGSCLMFPVTLMILATALSFGPYMGFVLAFTGSLLGGLASYLMGRWLGRDVVRKLAGEKINRLSRKLARRGWLAVAVVRVIPIAPFTIVNLVAGSTHISTRSFLIGTAVGMGPGILAIMLFEGALEHAIRTPDWVGMSVSILALVSAAVVLYFCKHWLLSRDENNDG